MSWQDQVHVVFGVIFIAIGLAYLLSARFTDIALGWTSQGILWERLLGDRWARLVARFFFWLVSIALGAWVIHSVWQGA